MLGEPALGREEGALGEAATWLLEGSGSRPPGLGALFRALDCPTRRSRGAAKKKRRLEKDAVKKPTALGRQPHL